MTNYPGSGSAFKCTGYATQSSSPEAYDNVPIGQPQNTAWMPSKMENNLLYLNLQIRRGREEKKTIFFQIRVGDTIKLTYCETEQSNKRRRKSM
jgi:hypothetical protein